jgi:2,4-dienoyl-CoA reductase-like NADH-dependent reductase (Old Yellow Enzyme family)
VLDFAQELMREGAIDYIDLSLWDCFKGAEEPAFAGRHLMALFNELERGGVRLGVAGKIMSAEEAQACLDTGMDFVLIGRGGILHHDYPRRVMANADFRPIDTPVSEAHLLAEGLSPKFVEYMGTWAGFVEGASGGRHAGQRGPSSYSLYKEKTKNSRAAAAAEAEAEVPAPAAKN